MQLDRTSLELRHKSIQHHGKSTRSQQQHLCVFGVIVVTSVGINPLLCLGRLYCTPWSQNHPSFPFILPVFLSVSTSWGFILFPILDVFPSLCCFRLSNLSDPLWLSLSLALRQQPLSIFPLYSCGLPGPGFLFSFLSSPLSLPLQVHLAEYWPPDDNKNPAAPRLVKFWAADYPLYVLCFLDSHPVWKHRYQRWHTACLFLFLKAAFLERSSLMCVFADSENEAKKAKEEGGETVETKGTETGTDIKNGKTVSGICVQEKY